MASSAVRAPLVLGKRLRFCFSKGAIMSSAVLAESSTRLRATVTNSEPEALAAAAMREEEENFPVPKKRREVKVLSAMVNIVLRFTEV